MSEQKKRVSIVIPVRNGLPFFSLTLESVLSELGSFDELIIQENFSTDGTAEYLRQQNFPGNVRVIYADFPLTAAENWSSAVAEASGLYIKILCADDIIYPGSIDFQAKLLEKHPDCVLVAQRRAIVNGKGKVLISSRGLKKLIGYFSGQDAICTALMSGTNPFGETSGVMYLTDAIKRELPFTSQFPYLTDLDMHVRVLKHGDFVGSSTTGSAFRVHKSNWSNELTQLQYSQYVEWLCTQDAFNKFSIVKRLVTKFRVRLNTELRKLFF